MAYCEKCGQKNPDGAAFCGACGSPMAPSTDTASGREDYSRREEDSREEPRREQPRREEYTREESTGQDERIQRVVLRPRREANPPRRETTPPPRREREDDRSREHDYDHHRDRERNRDYERGRERDRDYDPRRERDYNRNRERRGGGSKEKKSGCLSRLLGWLVIGIVAIGLIWWAFNSFTDGGGSDMSNYERIMTDEELDEIISKSEFPTTTEVASPREGTYSYTGEIEGATHTISMKYTPISESKKVVGQLKMYADGKESLTFFCAYCGRSVYAVYPDSSQVGMKTDGYIYVKPGGRTIILNDGNVELELED